LSPGRGDARSRRCAAALALLCMLAAMAPALAAPRDDFLRAELALAQGRTEQALAIMSGLEDYVLAPYLELAFAEQGIAHLPHARIAGILERNADIPVAWRLRRKWIERLAAEREWELLVRHHVHDGHAVSACHAAHAQVQRGRAHEAWPQVATLWLTASSLPEECDRVLDAWRAAGQLTPERAWDRAALAVSAGNIALARYLERYLADADARVLARWIALRAAPDGLVAFVREGGLDDTRGEAVLHDVFSRAARRDAHAARRLWLQLAGLDLEPALLDTLRERIGVALAHSDDADALDWLDRARSAGALEARALAALRAGRWGILAESVAAMAAEESGSERWRYWQGRAWHALDDARGDAALRSLAAERSYYGFLAADRVAMPYALRDRPTAADAAQLRALQASAAVLRVSEWRALGRSLEARREWEQILAQPDTARQRAAAVLAHRWGWHHAAIRAAAAAQDWDDLALRFPLAHADSVRTAAAGSALPAARIYAVIRQESAFMHDVRSSAGALGLMQLMPATARQVARRAKLPDAGRPDLLDPTRNLLLGSLYLARLEQRYGGHPVLASAAYNAGPGRVRRWLPGAGTVDSDVWIETVPFNETRGYLRAVLAYQIIYARRLGEDALRLRDLMPAVPPRVH
jgi:soluble lytic murein transglycosylase